MIVLYFSVDQLHPRLAGPLGGPEEQHAELLQVSGWDRVRLPGFPLPQQGRRHCEYCGSFATKQLFFLLIVLWYSTTIYAQVFEVSPVVFTAAFSYEYYRPFSKRCLLCNRDTSAKRRKPSLPLSSHQQSNFLLTPSAFQDRALGMFISIANAATHSPCLSVRPQLLFLWKMFPFINLPFRSRPRGRVVFGWLCCVPLLTTVDILEFTVQSLDLLLVPVDRERCVAADQCGLTQLC